MPSLTRLSLVLPQPAEGVSLGSLSLAHRRPQAVPPRAVAPASPVDSQGGRLGPITEDADPVVGVLVRVDSNRARPVAPRDRRAAQGAPAPQLRLAPDPQLARSRNQPLGRLVAGRGREPVLQGDGARGRAGVGDRAAVHPRGWEHPERAVPREGVWGRRRPPADGDQQRQRPLAGRADQGLEPRGELGQSWGGLFAESGC